MKMLERAAEGEIIVIPQRDGTVRRFPFSELPGTFLNGLARHLGEDEPEHPLSVAASNSNDPEWRDSAFAGLEEVGEPPADLSE